MPSALNLHTNVLLRSEQTGGRVSVTEIEVPPHTAGPPLHTHDFDEAFYVLEGELVFQVQDELVTRRAGASLWLARVWATLRGANETSPAPLLARASWTWNLSSPSST